jgi:3-methyladenine DNA glycosylase/8-oxoguanine DNA glycosylase
MTRAAVRHLKRADPRLAVVIEAVGPCRYEVLDDVSHFEALIRSIVYQQLSGKAAATIHGRMLALFEGAPTPAALLHVPDADLRGAGLSRQKISYLRDLAEKVDQGIVPLDGLAGLDDAAVSEALCAIKGIGRWTAQMFLMFRLGRPDVLPTEDLGIRKAVQRAYRMRSLPTPARVLAVGKRWSPYSTIACWYLWRSLDPRAPVGPGAT